MLKLDIEQVKTIQNNRIASNVYIWHIVSIEWISKWQKYVN